MTQFTSKAIEESFIRLLNERPLDKITIKDIVDDCGISRNTFYYHFQDITALLEHILNADVERVLSQHLDMDSWEDGFISAARFALENKPDFGTSVHCNELSADRKTVQGGIGSYFFPDRDMADRPGTTYAGPAGTKGRCLRLETAMHLGHAYQCGQFSDANWHGLFRHQSNGADHSAGNYGCAGGHRRHMRDIGSGVMEETVY